LYAFTSKQGGILLLYPPFVVEVILP